jgi:hypothetical protein
MEVYRSRQAWRIAYWYYFFSCAQAMSSVSSRSGRKRAAETKLDGIK